MALEIKYFFGAVFAAVLAWIAAAYSWVISLHLAIQFLFWFQLGDILSGLGASIYLQNTASHIAWKGITVKKCLSWLVVGAMVGVAALFKAISGVAAELSIGTFSMPLGAGAAFWYCLVEAMSILENAGKVGALPPGMLDIVRKYLPGARPPAPDLPKENPAALGSMLNKP